ncbi:MAG: glutathione peroxidase [Planctomycetes bacterium]|nr:glutathione peroxidase [Planctomycetota bacterium]
MLAALPVGCGRDHDDAGRRGNDEMAESFWALEADTLAGAKLSFEELRGQVVLIVNTASECGFTGQYAGLEVLHERFGDRGLRVIGMPANDFGAQEPGDAEAIQRFCTEVYQVTFTMLAKGQVLAGPGQSPLYRHLEAAAGVLPSWNFGKYLIGRDGRVVGYFPSKVEPLSEELTGAIEAALR